MKRKFGENYSRVSKTDMLPKVMVKMGSMHLARGKNWMHIFDLGTMIKELSYFNGTQSTTINCFTRYTQNKNGTLDDYLEDEDGKALQPLLELAKKAQWTVLETKPILKHIEDKKLLVSKDLKILISGFDIVLFPPVRILVQWNYLE